MYGIALDIGTSGLRCQAVDIETKKTLATAITARHPIPGMNVIDHVNFAMDSGPDVAHNVMIGAINNLFEELNIDLSKVVKVGVCGNPFQLSIFQNIEIRDLAYAGKNKLEKLGVVSPPRDGDIIPASDVGLVGMPNATVFIPPAVTHEIGADAIAMLKATGILDSKEPCLMVDYGTNAEMALIVNGNVYTGSAAAGPALEGQQLENGMLAAEGAICDVEVTDKGWKCFVLDETMSVQEGDIVDPRTGETVVEGPMHGRAIGITGTGVVSAMACGFKSGIATPTTIDSEDQKIHLQNNVVIGLKDIDEAGKAIGALRAGFLTLMDAAGLWVDDIKIAYMSGATGLYVDARKAQAIGMVTPGAERLVQFGNTSITLAREIVFGEVSMDDLKEFAQRLKATHCMFATSKVFQDIYGVEISYWSYNMPFASYNDMLDLNDIKPIPLEPVESTSKRVVARDLPDVEEFGVKIIQEAGVILEGILEECTGCKKCENECPENALKIEKVDVGFNATVRSDLCGGTACRRCERACKDEVFRYNILRIRD